MFEQTFSDPTMSAIFFGMIATIAFVGGKAVYEAAEAIRCRLPPEANVPVTVWLPELAMATIFVASTGMTAKSIIAVLFTA